MKKTLASAILFFAMFTNLNAIEAPIKMKDSNCTSKMKCKIENSKDSNCTGKMKCKTEKKSNCSLPCKIKDCTKCNKDTSPKSSPTWSSSADMNSSLKKPSCCAGKKKRDSQEEKTTNEVVPMKCAPGKCGGGK